MRGGKRCKTPSCRRRILGNKTGTRTAAGQTLLRTNHRRPRLFPRGGFVPGENRTTRARCGQRGRCTRAALLENTQSLLWYCRICPGGISALSNNTLS